jgi:hypothetical protein
LSVESTPPGAQVFEGAASLGVTPMTVTLVLSDPAKPRLLVLRKPGYKPYSLEQGPARGEVRVHAVLVPEAPAEPQPAVAASAAPPPPLRPAPRSAVSKKTAPKVDPSAPAGDIRLQR